jgi:hypothetical protein
MTDLRVTIGFFFLLLGAILCVLGVADAGLRAPLTEVNVNLYAGACILIFGGVMLWLGKRHS